MTQATPTALTVQPGTRSETASSDHEWWRTAVVYQVYPRSFADSDGDGVGDLPGLISRLDYLHELGVDAVWLSPIYASPGDDNGYDISDYQAIDPTFGTMADFDRLVDGLHSRGMRLIMDLVVNHTSDEHPWFVESASALDSPKRDWYWWRQPRTGLTPGASGAEPTNWESFFSGPTWDYDPKTGEYYLHLFSRKQPDLNWENPDVREAIYSMMRWWLDRGVDGFRMDVINLISKDTALPDGPVPPGRRYGDGTASYISGPRIHEFIHEMHEQVIAPRGGGYVTVGEMPGVRVEDAALFTDPQRGELDMVFQFEHVGLDHGPSGKWEHRPFDPLELKRSFRCWQDGLAERGWNSLYWNNHDQPRVVSRFGDDTRYRVESAKLLAAILHLQRGTPYIYQGEELGMTNGHFPEVADLRDIESLNHLASVAPDQGAGPEQASSADAGTSADAGSAADAALAGIRRMGRDNARTPMQWTAGPNAGFTTGRPWIAVNPNHEHINAENQRDDADSVFAFYRALIALRHDEPVVAFGDFRMVAPDHPTLFAFVRTLESTELLVVGNLSGVPLPLEEALGSETEGWADAALLLGNVPDAPAPTLDHLRPWEVRALIRRG